jgi:nucleoside-diphosphate-sugar epimerase
MKTVTILGSSGQIGAYLTTYLRDKGYKVYEFDIVRSSLEDLTYFPNQILEKKIQDSDFVFFLAFDVGGSRYLAKYQHTFDFINNNTRLMAQTFGFLEKYNKPFVFASSQMSNMSYSPYGVLKRVGELYTKSLKGLTVKFWNVYGIEHDEEKSHVITDFIRKGFEVEDGGTVNMLTDGTEERQFLYAEDCCEALETVMNCFTDFKVDDPLHITSFNTTTIKEIALIITGQFNLIDKTVIFKPAEAKDTVQQNKKNEADTYISGWWLPKTNIQDGIMKVFNDMKREYKK